MLPRMSTATLQACELLFPSAQSKPHSVVIIGATGHVGFGKLCQLVTRFAKHGGPMIPVVALDPSERVLSIKEKLAQRLSKTLSQAEATRALNAISIIQGRVQDLPEDLNIGWALEAVPEDLALKQSVYQALLERSSPPSLLASTTSAYTSQTLFGSYANKDRCAVLHPFFPHHKNPLWELASKNAVTSAKTLDKVRQLMTSLELKVIEVADVPAFAADRVFCGLMLHAVKASEDLSLEPKAIDDVTQELIGCAPFRVHNMIPGSNGLSMHCMELCHQEHPSSLFAAPESWLAYQSDPNRLWPMEIKQDSSQVPKDAMRERMLGALACICAYLLQHDIVSPEHLDLLCTDALAFRQGPCALFRELGISKVQATAKTFLASAKITRPERVAPLDALALLG